MKLSRVRILPGFYILVAFALLLVPFKWLAAWTVAAVIHELFHVLFLRLFGYRILSAQIGPTGANIKTDGQTGMKMAICAMAGPLSGLLLLPLLRIMPRLALCGAILSLCNLVPVYPLDGGRVVRGLVEHHHPPEKAKRILQFWEDIVLFLLAVLAVYASVRLRLGLYPAVWIGLLIGKNKNIACKRRHLRVQ